MSQFNTLNKANELLAEMNEALNNIEEELTVLESFDWVEVFPLIEDTDTREMVQDAILNIRINIRNLEV